MKKRKTPGTPPLLKRIVRALDDKKAEDLTVIDVIGVSSVTDYLVLATGTSEPHLRALRIAVEKEVDEAGSPVAGRESGTMSGWVVIDAYQIMVHVFTERKRSAYNLEMLWRDGRVIDHNALLEDFTHPSRRSTSHKE